MCVFFSPQIFFKVLLIGHWFISTIRLTVMKKSKLKSEKEKNVRKKMHLAVFIFVQFLTLSLYLSPSLLPFFSLSHTQLQMQLMVSFWKCTCSSLQYVQLTAMHIRARALRERKSVKLEREKINRWSKKIATLSLRTEKSKDEKIFNKNVPIKNNIWQELRL